MSWTIEGVEYMEGTLGPRCVMPISGVVVMVISSEMPGANSAFNTVPSVRRARVRATEHRNIRMWTRRSRVWFPFWTR